MTDYVARTPTGRKRGRPPKRISESTEAAPKGVHEIREQTGSVERIVEDDESAGESEDAEESRYLGDYVPGGLDPSEVDWECSVPKGQEIDFQEMLTLVDSFLRTPRIQRVFPGLSIRVKRTEASARVCWRKNMSHVFATLKPGGAYFASSRLRLLFLQTPRIRHYVWKKPEERMAELKGLL